MSRLPPRPGTSAAPAAALGIALGLGAALVLGLGSPARAWTPIAGSRPTWDGPVPYALNQAGSADLGGFAATEVAVRQGMDDWTRRACTSLTTSYRGSTTDVAFQSGAAVISWYESGWPESPSAIGVTGPAWDGSGRIVDAHMAMNGVHFTWTNDPGSGSRVNAYSIVLHEGGHYFGIGHSADRGATMFPSYSGGIMSLNGDDEAGICTLYPGSGGGTVDCTTTGCPSGQVCTGGRCVAMPGDGRTCDACGSDADCAGRCLRYPDGRGYCGDPCSSTAECGGDACERVSDGSMLCVRRSAAGAGDCSAAPGPGPDPDPPPPSGCTGDSACAPGQRCEVATGVCVAGPAGALGDPCASNDQCETTICAVDPASVDSYCTRLCDASDPCPVGFGCADGLCRPGRAGLGDACRANDDCTSGICAEGPDGPFCTRSCIDGSCPGEFVCVPVGDGSVRVCAPVAGGGGLASPASRALRGGCAVARGGSAQGAQGAALGLLVLVARRRRRSSRRV